MRGRMISVIHRNNYSKKSTYLRHGAICTQTPLPATFTGRPHRISGVTTSLPARDGSLNPPQADCIVAARRYVSCGAAGTSACIRCRLLVIWRGGPFGLQPSEEGYLAEPSARLFRYRRRSSRESICNAFEQCLATARWCERNGMPGKVV